MTTTRQTSSARIVPHFDGIGFVAFDGSRAGCMAYGDTELEALTALIDARREFDRTRDYDDEISQEQADAIKRYIERTGHSTEVSEYIHPPAW